MLILRRRTCYHRGGEEERWSGVAWHAPMPSDHPRQALTRLEGTPDIYQYTGVARGSHRPLDDVSLHIASHCFAPGGHAERRPPMKSSSYGERDYAFGRAMLTLRTTIGTQDPRRGGCPCRAVRPGILLHSGLVAPVHALYRDRPVDSSLSTRSEGQRHTQEL